MPPRQITTQSFTTTGAESNVVFTIPNGHTCGFAEMENVVATAGNGHMFVQAGNSDVFRSTADHLAQRFTTVETGNQLTTEPGMRMVDSYATVQKANAEFWNLNTAAPILCFGQGGPLEEDIRHANLVPDATAYSQLKFRQMNNTATAETVMDSGGVFTLTTWKRKATVFSQTASADTQLDFLNLSKYEALVIGSHDLTLSASDLLEARLSPDGASFDSGAADYFDHVSSTQSTHDALKMSAQSRTASSFCAVLTGLNQVAQTQMDLMYDFRATIFRQKAGWRDLAQAEQAIRFLLAGANNMASGTIYVTGYEL